MTASSLDRHALTTGTLVRTACRDGQLSEHTAGLADGFAQANLVILPHEYSGDFLNFCRRNPQPCPLLDVTSPGSPVPTSLAPAADLRTDLPRYRVWEHGQIVDEPVSITDLWQDDWVSFLIGCSFTFEGALQRAGLPIRHLEQASNVPMYRTTIACQSAGVFSGPLVVSMRPYTPADAIRAVQITSRFPKVHGAPVHLGLPDQLGIDDLSRPDYGDPVPIGENELPVFWACGVTPQAALAMAHLPLAITHAPGCMFVGDIRDEDLDEGEDS